MGWLYIKLKFLIRLSLYQDYHYESLVLENHMRLGFLLRLIFLYEALLDKEDQAVLLLYQMPLQQHHPVTDQLFYHISHSALFLCGLNLISQQIL